MAVSKRTRFEVLRRDEFRCQYCGLAATDTGEGLTIDHVVPVALGGSDGPENLVAACRDCNAGKTSIQPDSPLVARVSQSSIEWALAAANRNAQIEADFRAMEEFEEDFLTDWQRWTVRQGIKDVKVPLPPDWRASLKRWWRMSVPKALIQSAVDTAMGAPGVASSDTFRYFAGIIWRTLDEYDSSSNQQTNSGRVYGPDEVEDIAQGREQEGARSLLDLGYRAARILDVSDSDWGAAWSLACDARYAEVVGGANG